MKRIFFCSVMAMLSILASYAQVEVEIIDGSPNESIKSIIERNASHFMSEVYNAYNENRALKLTGLVATDAENSIEMLWENVHFRSEDQYVGEILLNSADGYQLRNIPLEIQPQDKGSDVGYKEAVIGFDKSGRISSVYFSIDNNTYRNIMEKGIQLNDVERRLEILDYVEKFRTSYNQKDITFLNQVFSDDALIITGKVVTPRKTSDGLSITLPTVKYTKQDKKQYLTNLKRVFQNTRYINVNFDDVVIKRHGANPDIYGVRVIQHWNTSNYSDEGYVYMVWDFTNPKAPQIHVRTWQPMYLDKAKTQPLPKEEIFDLNSFDGI